MKTPKLIITNKCNNACQFCFQPFEIKNSGNNINIDLFERLLFWLEKQKINKITLLGGEPTIHPNFSQLIEIASNHNFEITILSNLLIDLSTKKLNSKVKTVSANLTLYNEYSYNEQKQILNNLKLFKDFNIQVIPSFTLFTIQQNMEPIIELTAEYSNIQTMRIDFARPSPSKENKYVSFKELEDYKPKLLSLIKKINDIGIDFTFDCPLPKCYFSQEEIDRFRLSSKNLSHNCGILIINPDLSLGSCPYYKLLDKKIVEFESYQAAEEIVLSNPKITKLKYGVYTFEKCKNCQYNLDKTCSGYCLADK